jgi:hypothetical protein
MPSTALVRADPAQHSLHPRITLTTPRVEVVCTGPQVLTSKGGAANRSG